MLKQIMFILMIIFISCSPKVEHKEDVTKSLKPDDQIAIHSEKSIFDESLDQDCPVKGLSGIFLIDAQSTNVIDVNVLWSEINKNSEGESLPNAQFLNTNKTEKITFITHPGGLKGEIAEFILERSSGVDTNLPILEKLTSIKTDNGLFLGQSIDEVKDILEKVKGLSIAELYISLRIESMDPKKSECLKRVNLPIYYLKLSFDDSKKLESIKFGYEYP